MQVVPLRERFLQRPRRRHARRLDVPEDRRLLHPQPDVERHRHEHDRDQKRHAPAPGAKHLGAHGVLHDQNDDERHEQSERRRDLDEARVEAAPLVGHVFRDVHGRAAVLAAEREALQHANHEERDRRRDPDRPIGRQEADDRRRAAHDEERDEKRVLAADEIADPPEEQRPERPDDEPDRKRRQVRDERDRVVARRIEQRRDDRGQTAEDVEVVPLDHRPHGRRGDDLPDA